MPKVRLKHTSRAEGSEGNPGDIVTASAELAEFWVSDGAAELVEDTEVKAEPKTKSKEKGLKDEHTL